jgi:hypothetical protein
MTSGKATSLSSARDTWTYAEYARLPDDGNHYEVLDGEVLVTPAPGTRHQVVAARLFSALDQHVRRYQLGFVRLKLQGTGAPLLCAQLAPPAGVKE